MKPCKWKLSEVSQIYGLCISFKVNHFLSFILYVQIAKKNLGFFIEISGDLSTSSSTDDSSSSVDRRPSDLETSGGFTSTSADVSSSSESGASDLETSGGFTSTSAMRDSTSEESEKIDLLAELQAAAVLEG